MTFGLNLAASENSTSLIAVLSFLKESNINYRVCHFPTSSPEEIEQEISRLGMGLVEAIPLDVQGQAPILAIIPSSLMLQVTELSKLLAPRVIRHMPPNEIYQCFSMTRPTSLLPPLGRLFEMETFLSPLIEQQRTVGFLVESKNTLITMVPSEFRRTYHKASAIPLPTGPRYRAYTSPGRQANQRCILGVSLENSDFHTAKLITITDWISKNYTDCTVMLGDGLHRITLQLNSNATENEALDRSKWLARDFVYSQLAVFKLRECECRFNFVFCSEIQTTDRYLEYYRQLFGLFEDDKEFQNSVRVFASEFLRRKPQRQEHEKKPMEMSCRYLLEELAAICCLAQDSPCTFVYPGSLTILQEIAEGKHPSVPSALLQVEYVELKLKNRSNEGKQ